MTYTAEDGQATFACGYIMGLLSQTSEASLEKLANAPREDFAFQKFVAKLLELKRTMKAEGK